MLSQRTFVFLSELLWQEQVAFALCQQLSPVQMKALGPVHARRKVPGRRQTHTEPVVAGERAFIATSDRAKERQGNLRADLVQHP